MQYGDPIVIHTKPKKMVEVEIHVPKWQRYIDWIIIPICLIGLAWTGWLYLS
jgi:bacteriorhodopsin